MNRAILVKSCRSNAARQLACERSWAGYLRWNSPGVFIPVRAIEGNDSDHHAIGLTKIEVRCGDKYPDNSKKLQLSLGVLLAYDHMVDWVFVCDDDTFVHPARWLAHEPQGDLECRLYSAKPEERNRHQLDQWVNGGAGYWMSRRLCELYIQECNERTSAEDILVYRIAQKHGLEIVDRQDLYGDDRYEQMPAGQVSASNQLITCHPVAPEEMQPLYEATKAL